MTASQALTILEAMVDGCSPITGEVLPSDHLLLDEQVMEAVLIAIEALHGKAALGNGRGKIKPSQKPNNGQITSIEIVLPDADLMEAVAFYRSLSINPTAHRVAAFLCGDRSVKEEALTYHSLYGKYGSRYSKPELVPWMDAWMVSNNIHPPRESTKEMHPFFAEPHHNKLSEAAVTQLKTKVAAIPLQRVEGLSEDLIERRKTLPRSHEPWPDEELRLLKKATEFTNDIELLSSCFGRSPLALSAQAEKWLSPTESSEAD